VIERSGSVTSEELIAQLSAVLGTDALIGVFNPKRKRLDERIAHKNVRKAVADAVRRLAALGFVDVDDEERLRLRPALMRFAEPVRAAAEPAAALAKLVAQGEVAFTPDESSVQEEELAEGGDAEEVEEAEPGDEPWDEPISEVSVAASAVPAADGGELDSPAAHAAARDFDWADVDTTIASDNTEEERAFEWSDITPNAAASEGDADLAADGAHELASAEEDAEQDRELAWSDVIPPAVADGGEHAESDEEQRELSWADVAPAEREDAG
jgi:hypothetical protein